MRKIQKIPIAENKAMLGALRIGVCFLCSFAEENTRVGNLGYELMKRGCKLSPVSRGLCYIARYTATDMDLKAAHLRLGVEKM